MKRLISILFPLAAFVALAVPFAAQADEPVQIGSVLTLGISVCASKESAMKVVDAVQENKEKADQLFDDDPLCGNVPLRFKVGNVVHVVNIGNTVFVKVVEITNPDDETQKLYWLTAKQIVKYKIERES